MTKYVNVDNDTSSTTSNEGENCRGQQLQSLWRQRRLRINSNDVCASANGDNTASYEAATRQEAEAAHLEAEAARGREPVTAQ
jgi:hypothetical protein